jgi:hypothetical protein
MDTIQYTRLNDLWRGASSSPPRPDLGPALGTWYNCNVDTGEILSLSLSERDGELVLRAFGALDRSQRDWGETAAVPHVSSLDSTEVSGFTALYDFGFMETQIAANLKHGVLVIQSYNTFRDKSSRPSYFTREFFHQNLSPENSAARFAGPGGAGGPPCRMVSDDPANHTGPLPGTVDLSALIGGWRNTYRASKGIHRVLLAREADRYTLHAWGVGCDQDWGEVPVVPHATHVASQQPAGFLARYHFGFAELSLAANEAKGLLIIASFSTFRDSSARSSYFTREFFYREGNDASP